MRLALLLLKLEDYKKHVRECIANTFPKRHLNVEFLDRCMPRRHKTVRTIPASIVLCSQRNSGEENSEEHLARGAVL
jgi:hypothetical protein